MKMPLPVKLGIGIRYAALVLVATIPTLSCKTPVTPPVDDADGATEISDTIFEAAPAPSSDATPRSGCDPLSGPTDRAACFCATQMFAHCAEGLDPKCQDSVKNAIANPGLSARLSPGVIACVNSLGTAPTPNQIHACGGDCSP